MSAERGFGMLRLLLAPIQRRRSRALLSLLGLALGACLITVLVSLYHGVQANLATQFRRYGVNLVATPPPGQRLLTEGAAAQALARFPDGAGVLYEVVQVNGRPVVLAGADIARLRAMNPTWRVSGATPRANEAWLGRNAARLLHAGEGATLAVGLQRQHALWRVAGIVDAGTAQDNEILAPYAQVATLSGDRGFTTLEFWVAAGSSGMMAAMGSAERELQPLLAGAQLQPVRQIASSEASVLLSTRGMLLVTSTLILFTVGLCVAAALTTLALERRQDFAVMKALGAGERQVMTAFVGEAALLGVTAAVLGGLVGTLLAGSMGEALFALWIWPTPWALGLALGLTVGLAAMAAMLPWPVIHATSPAAILRGE